MIDSVTLHIIKFVTYSEEFFTKEKYQNIKGKYGIFGRIATRYTDYPQHCKTEGRYFPQVQIVERLKRTKLGMIPIERKLVVQVSLPKLIFGTSIFDIDEHLLSVVAQKLAEVLKEIKVGVLAEDILEAIVVRVDYSKILQISPSFGDTDRILRALLPYDLKQSSDFTRRDFHDGKDGFYIKFYNSSQGFVLYNKFDEVVTNGTTNIEKEIARQYKAGGWTKGALRIELSLQKKQTVEATLRQFSGTGKKKDFTLRDVARTDIAKACLLRTFESVYIKDFSRLVRLSGLKDTELRHIIKEHVSKFQDRAVIYYLTHRVREIGLKRAIEELKHEVSPASIGRYKKMVEIVLAKVEAKKDVVDVVSYLHRKLKTFEPVLPKNLKAILDVADVPEKV